MIIWQKESEIMAAVTNLELTRLRPLPRRLRPGDCLPYVVSRNSRKASRNAVSTPDWRSQRAVSSPNVPPPQRDRLLGLLRDIVACTPRGKPPHEPLPVRGPCEGVWGPGHASDVPFTPRGPPQGNANTRHQPGTDVTGTPSGGRSGIKEGGSRWAGSGLIVGHNAVVRALEALAKSNSPNLLVAKRVVPGSHPAGVGAHEPARERETAQTARTSEVAGSRDPCAGARGGDDAGAAFRVADDDSGADAASAAAPRLDGVGHEPATVAWLDASNNRAGRSQPGRGPLINSAGRDAASNQPGHDASNMNPERDASSNTEGRDGSNKNPGRGTSLSIASCPGRIAAILLCADVQPRSLLAPLQLSARACGVPVVGISGGGPAPAAAGGVLMPWASASPARGQEGPRTGSSLLGACLGLKRVLAVGVEALPQHGALQPPQQLFIDLLREYSGLKTNAQAEARIPSS
eukprot:jgi/Mesvir1/794/Mv25678-RA.2